MKFEVVSTTELLQIAEQQKARSPAVAAWTRQIARSIADIVPNDAPLMHVADDDGCALDNAID